MSKVSPAVSQLAGEIETILCGARQYMDGCKAVYPQEWSAWDQEIREGLTFISAALSRREEKVRDLIELVYALKGATIMLPVDRSVSWAEANSLAAIAIIEKVDAALSALGESKG